MANLPKLAKRGNTDDNEIVDFLSYDFEKSAEEAAMEVNCNVVRPEDNQLFIDIDSEEQFENFKRRWDDILNIANSDIANSTIKITVSKSGLPNRHITVSLYDNGGEKFPVTESQRIMLQFALGSDPIRETLSVYRWLALVDGPTRFFEPNENGVLK